MTRRGTLPPALLLLLLAAALVATTTTVSGQGRPVTDSGAETPPTPSSFTPKDSFLIDCGGTAPVTADGKSYKTDAQANHLLSANDAIRVAADDKADVPSPLYATARVFKEEAVYSFPLTVPGWHFIRIYLFPIKGGDVDLASATFSVVTDDNVLLHSFTPENKPVMKEFVINATENHLALKFQPLKGSAAFVNAIEVVNAPDELITDSALAVAPLGEITGLVHDAYQVLYRINVGGPAIGPANDTLGRQWETDAAYVQTKEAVKDVSVPTSTIKFPDGTSRLVAPTLVYASAAKMADADVGSPTFNLTWKVDVDPSFSYLVRLFFADIVSKATNDLYFDVYISGRKAVSGLDLSTVTGGELAAPYYKDFVVNSSSLEGADGKGKLSVQVGPMGQDTGRIDALLNGMEVLKMSNSVGSLDGEFGVDGRKADDGSGGRKAVAAVGFAMMFGAFAGLGAMVVKWYKRPQDWERRESFSSWLLPIHTGQSFTASGKGGLAEWGMQWKRKGLIEKIMDPKLAGTVNPESLAKFAETAEKCLAEFGSDRISMGDVLWNLEYALQLQDANPPEGAQQDGEDGAAASGGGGGAVVPAASASGGGVPDASTTAAGELFQQLADMKGR
ncbi:unnamed protein product [Miscanthus lutarioriparius]|uniref:Malectin-like domain-containing protein n=1 Tax=Miscanthus lutarioriparius TaxID=422564 RepID=A0A811S6Q0_9POAL|nr:unnamed protein product [Miscanthus lutarioriparius]